MLAITRFVKKDKLFGLIRDPNIGKFEIQTSLNKSLKNDTIVKTRIYLRIPKIEFYNFFNASCKRSPQRLRLPARSQTLSA